MPYHETKYNKQSPIKQKDLEVAPPSQTPSNTSLASLLPDEETCRPSNLKKAQEGRRKALRATNTRSVKRSLQAESESTSNIVSALVRVKLNELY